MYMSPLKSFSKHRCFSSSSTLPQKIMLTSRSPSVTNAIGGVLGSFAEASDIILLNACVGVGKSVFARGFIRAATRNSTLHVSSPSFVYDLSYITPEGLVVHHIDAYRIDSLEDARKLNLRSTFENDCAIIEWSERILELIPDENLKITISLVEDDDINGNNREWDTDDASPRLLTIESNSKKWNQRLSDVYPLLQNISQNSSVD